MNETYIPRWLDRAKPFLGVGAAVGTVYLIVVVGFGAAPRTTDVGYSPVQPVEFSHALHAGQYGMDCRFCHTTVEGAAHAAVPPTATCMNCHTTMAADEVRGKKLKLVRESYQTGRSLPWVRVHDLPDYVFFDHSAHVARGVGCVSCHGRVDQMERVWQHETLSMAWCLDCHRNPERHLRPKGSVTKHDWEPDEDPEQLGRRLRQEYRINPSTDCSTCHR
ncbi:MAG: cytochrome C [Planctomycetes bacterium]|nr:cytochrome C [Planctomycetota bacterium]